MAQQDKVVDDDEKAFLDFVNNNNNKEGGRIRGGARALSKSMMSPPDENFVMFRNAVLSDAWNTISCNAVGAPAMAP